MTPASTLDTRSEHWRAELGGAFNRLAPAPLEDRLPDGRLAGRDLGQLLAFQVDGTPQVVRRSSAAVRVAPADLYKICVQVRGRATVRQDGRELLLEPGQMAIYDTGRPYELRLEHRWTCAVLAFPRSALGLPEQVISSAMDRTYPLAEGPGAILEAFVRGAVGRHDFHGGAANRLGEAGLHLIASTLTDAATPDADTAADALRLQILAYIRKNLGVPGLCHAQVAAAHGLAGRTLHRLFEGEPYTVTDYIRAQRLAAAHRDLTDPLLANRTIAALAARWGFTELAHFSRAYRTRYGRTPSQARRQPGR